MCLCLKVKNIVNLSWLGWALLFIHVIHVKNTYENCIITNKCGTTWARPPFIPWLNEDHLTVEIYSICVHMLPQVGGFIGKS